MITDRKVRIAIIGAGNMANNVHYPSLASFDDVEIVGVIETRAERLNTTCDRFGIPASARFLTALDTDYQTILNDLRPDGVYVIGQPEIMYPIWHWCLTNGFNLYIEKPMGLTTHQAEALAYLADSKGLITQVSHQRRTAPILQKIKARLLEKGPIIHGVVEFFKCDVTPMLIARDRMMDDGTHAIDTARWICGGEVVKVESECRRIGVPDINWFGATLHFDNGATCYVVCNWASGRRVFRTQMHVQGGYADVEVEAEGKLYLDNNYKGETLTTQEAAGSDDNFVFGGFAAKNREFIDSLKSGSDSCSSPFRDTVKTMRVCQTILSQALEAGV
ncbi:Gfo/Idh/MocA family oxidoreductase [Mesorhizobium sp. BR1-1-16]|uniref:Gfo/Idh/MocA family protein n=1 Tax=Mesorhizobium sp. BR1-1-16 TaxID=2876653 RepID=UPI001CCAF3CD|nr:Gfo/Idh/MocA family oxidoreductase [Mesorhizobium sp. BR1-1-16]MBZ9936848.1 Gfo/Idh/MocA family oxidoreductase [Mesorhizobium sp. BR1-1-16]